MSEPTTYDLIQDTRIQGVEDLVQTSYQPFQGPEFSYPVVHQPMDDEMWQYVTLGMGSGVLDVGGQPYWLRDLSDVTDTGKLTVSKTTGTAQAILRGFYHRLNQDMTLNFPPVSSKTVYHVVLEYDPLRHKEPGGPIRVRVLTSLDWSGGKHYLPLWDVERDPSQLLSQAVVRKRRPKISPPFIVDYASDLPDASTQLWGARAYAYMEGEEHLAWGSNEAGGPQGWTNLTNPPWKRVTPHASLQHGGRPAEWRFANGRFEMRGSLKLKTGSFDTTRPNTLGWTGGIEVPEFNAVVAANRGRCGVLRTQAGASVRDTFVLDMPETGISWVLFDGISIPLR